MTDKLTPETLRALADTSIYSEVAHLLLVAHADAWEAVRTTLIQEHEDHTDTLEQLAAALARVERLERVMKSCPRPDDNGDYLIGAMMDFCERVATLVAAEKKTKTSA